MKKTLTLVVLSFFCFVVVPHGSGMEEVSREEVIEEASRLTGLAKDTLELIYDDAPTLFDNLERVTFGVKVVHLFATAQDNEAMLELFDRFVDHLKSILLPNPLQTFLTAVKVYKTSLEVIRDYVVVPRFEESIYQNYRSMRLIDWRRGDTSEEAKNMAFESAVMGWSGYYLVQEKMYQTLLKRKGYNVDLLDAKLEKHFRSQIDRFWMNTLELRFQKEILADEEDAITSMLWQSVGSDLARLQQEAERRLCTPSPSPVGITATPFSSLGPEATSPEGTQLFSSFRRLLKEYIEAEITKSGGPASSFVEVGEAVKIASDIYEVGWKIFGYNDAGEKILISEDKTQGTQDDFREAIQYLEKELQAELFDSPQGDEISDTPQDSGFSEEFQNPQKDEVLSHYRAVLSQYLEKSARELEAWDQSRGMQNTYFFEILHAGTPVGEDRFFVSYRILVRLQNGDVIPVSSFEGEVNLGEVEAGVRSMLEFLGEGSVDEPSSEDRDVELPPSPGVIQESENVDISLEEPVIQGGNGVTEVVSIFRDFYPRYLAWLAEKET
ncbi:MAG: hypothetical protein N2Z84_00250, partial [Atribacterota bacterium]|nr:hypothetical protein [Atribacterota bacterium]